MEKDDRPNLNVLVVNNNSNRGDSSRIGIHLKAQHRGTRGEFNVPADCPKPLVAYRIRGCYAKSS